MTYARAAILLTLSAALTACASWSDATPTSRAQAEAARVEQDRRTEEEKAKEIEGAGGVRDLLKFAYEFYEKR